MTYTVIVSKGKLDHVFEGVRRFWADTKTLLLDMGDHHVGLQAGDFLPDPFYLPEVLKAPEEIE